MLKNVRYVPVLFIMILSIVLFSSPASAEVLVQDGFDLTSLNFVKTISTPGLCLNCNVYEINTQYNSATNSSTLPPKVGVKRYVLSMTPASIAQPRVIYGRSADNDGYALYTGRSKIATQVYFQHQTQILYVFDKPVTNMSVMFRYLNMRGFGGFMKPMVGHFDPVTFNFTWVAVFNADSSDWQDWRKDTNNRRWLHTHLHPNQIKEAAADREVNAVWIQEWDITNDVNGAFFDNIVITGDLPVSTPAPLGASIFARNEGNDITVTYLGKNAAYDHQLYLVNTGQLVFDDRIAKVGDTFKLGKFKKGEELIFKLHVLNSNKEFFSSNGKTFNEDQIDHVKITIVGNDAANFWWEDKSVQEGSDKDYNDIGFSIKGVDIK